MNNFVNKQHLTNIEEYLDPYLKKKPADCILHSEDGFQFKVHKELFGQTEFMRQILHIFRVYEFHTQVDIPFRNHL